MPDAYQISTQVGTEKVVLEIDADEIHHPDEGTMNANNYTTFTLDGEVVFQIESHKVETITPVFDGKKRVTEVNRYDTSGDVTI